MTDTVSTSADIDLSRPERRPFRRKPFVERPSPDVMARQARLAGGAWKALGSREAVMAFLNTHHDGLGGRPLDLALASDEGLVRVESAMALLPRPVD